MQGAPRRDAPKEQGVVRLDVNIELTVEQLAAYFAALDDDAQAQFFVEAAKHFEAFPSPGFVFQAHAVGRHLRDCECATPGGRRLVEEIAAAMTEVSP